MARIRTVKPDFWTDEKLTECSLSARLFFLGTLNFADDNGNLARSPKKLKMQIFPADALDCEPLIQELIFVGVLIEYSVSADKYLHIKGFKKHQVINRPSKSAIPQPPFDDDSLNTHGAITDGREGKGKEEERKGREFSTSGTGGVPPGPDDKQQQPQKSPEDLTKQEIWHSGRSLLAGSGMPEAQCGTFLGKLVADYGTEIVLDAVRTAVVEQPADPASFLKALCQKRKGERKTVAPWWSSDELILAKAAELSIKPLPGESKPTLKARIEAAIANDGKVPTPTPAAPLANPVLDEPTEPRSPEAIEAGLAAMREASSKLKRVA